MKNIAVVSLTNEYERRQHIDALFSEYELDFSYFDAISNQLEITRILKKNEIAMKTEKLSVGEIACYLSHYTLWQQVVEQNMPYLMIFEDDIYFSREARNLLNKPDWLPDCFDLIKLETTYEQVLVTLKGTPLSPQHRLCKLISLHTGTAGYIISYEGAKKLLAMVKKVGIERQVDRVIFGTFVVQQSNNIYQIAPALCIQDKIHNKDSVVFVSCLDSSLQANTQLIGKKKVTTIDRKLYREITRLLEQLRSIFNNISIRLQGFRKQKIDYRG